MAASASAVFEACPETVAVLWSRAKEKRPLVQCITNFVSMDFAANTLLAAGMSPAMVHAPDEVEEFVGVSSGLLINVGTLSSEWVASMKLAVMKAKAMGTPWVLDPVGVGATEYRTKVCTDLLRLGPTVVRGNASEIAALAGVASSTRGVDSTMASSDAADVAAALAAEFGCVVAVSGATDFVTDGTRTVKVENGVPMLCDITATGCSVTALIAGYVAANPDCPLLATATALSSFGVAAEQGAKSAAGPGSLRVNLLDGLYNMTEAELLRHLKLTEAEK